MKNNLLKTVFLLILIASITSCLTKNKCEHNYHFEFPVTISPVLDTFYIGDKIWVSIAYNSDILLDRNTNNEINVGDFNFDIDMNTLRIDSIDGFALNYFEVIQDVGTLARIDLVGAVKSSIQFETTTELKSKFKDNENY